MRIILKFKLLVLVFSLVLVGCGGKSDTIDTDLAAAEAQAQAEAENAQAAADAEAQSQQAAVQTQGSNASNSAAVATGTGEVVEAVSAANFYNHASNYTNSMSSNVVYFEFDRAVIPSKAFPALQDFAAFLKANPSATLRLEGHTDDRGTPEYNIALGERRAQAVAKFLRVNGVSASQLDIISYGEEKRASFGASDLAHAKNRRVALVK